MTKHIQMTLFNAPTLHISRPLKEAMDAASRHSGMSRAQIVDKMNDLADRHGVSLVSGNSNRLKLDTFEKWLNVNEKNRNIRLKTLPIFCAVVKDITPLNIIAQPLGAKVIGPEDQRLLKWAKAYHNAKESRKIMRQLETDL